MTEYLKVKNWEKYQHYKNRNPPWIKLHVSTLNDRDFISLSLASKGLLMQLWILASENEGKVPYDLGEIKFRLRDNTIQIEDINLLINKKFLKYCKQTLADESRCLSETETETETETEKKSLALPDWLDSSLWNDFKEHRRKLRKPMTQRAEEILIKKIEFLREQGNDPRGLLLTAIERGWQSVFPLNERK